jgi:rubrerythrin
MSENLKKIKKEMGNPVNFKVGLSRAMKRVEQATREKYSGLSGIESIEELERKAAEIKRQEDKAKERLRLTKEEYIKLINREAGTLNSMAKDEDEDANRYRSAANYSPLPTMKKLLLGIGAEEQVHAQRLRILATELERGIL